MLKRKLSLPVSVDLTENLNVMNQVLEYVNFFSYICLLML